MDQVAKRYLLDFQFRFSFGELTIRHTPNEGGNAMTTLLSCGVTAVFVPNPKGVFMKMKSFDSVIARYIDLGQRNSTGR